MGSSPAKPNPVSSALTIASTVFLVSTMAAQTPSPGAAQAGRSPVYAPHGVVATSQPLATAAGLAVPVAQGCGNARAFVCPYHGWTYDLAGKLLGTTDKVGFAGIDQASHGLVRLPSAERHVLAFLNRDSFLQWARSQFKT